MNRRVILTARPQGDIKETDFKIVSEPLDTTIKAGEVLVRVE